VSKISSSIPQAQEKRVIKKIKSKDQLQIEKEKQGARLLHTASIKITHLLSLHLQIKKSIRSKHEEHVKWARAMIIRAMRSNYYRRLFYQEIFVATIYLEISENISPQREVKIFGTYSKKPW
jgi:hypothetical protein